MAAAASRRERASRCTPPPTCARFSLVSVARKVTTHTQCDPDCRKARPRGCPNCSPRRTRGASMSVVNGARVMAPASTATRSPGARSSGEQLSLTNRDSLREVVSIFDGSRNVTQV
jgi:hypothetical protein